MNSSTTQVTLIPAREITPAQRQRMWTVYQPYYHYTQNQFMERFDRNTHYALYHQGNRLVGFTGLRIETVALAGRPNLLIYFGQTVVEAETRGQGLITRTGLLLFRKYWKNILSGRAYFWADSLTYRAYLVFAKNLEEYYPSRRPMPDGVEVLRNHIGQQYYGERFCPQTGTIKKDTYLLQDPSVQICTNKLQDPEIRFFQEANPLYTEGHGLLTLAPIHFRNLWTMVKKVLGKRRAAASRPTTPSRITTKPAPATESV